MDATLRRAVETARRNALSLMVDHVKVWRDGIGPAKEDEWGRVTPPPPTLVYEGPAKAQNDRTYPAGPDVGSVARVTTTVSSVHLPYGTTGVRPGDVCEWTEALNPRLVGVKVRLRSDEDKTWQTAVRFNVQEVIE